MEAIPAYTSLYFIEEVCPLAMKPDDGAGCQDARLFASLAAAEPRPRMHAASDAIRQPYARSVSLSRPALGRGDPPGRTTCME